MQLFAVEVTLNETWSNTATYLVFAKSRDEAGNLALKDIEGGLQARAYEVDSDIASRINLEPNVPWLIIRNELGHIPKV